MLFFYCKHFPIFVGVLSLPHTAAIYWLAKEETLNQQLIPHSEQLENLGVSELKYFQHRSRPSVRQTFITLGESIQEIILEKIRWAKSFGILADEAADVVVLPQLIIFLRYVSPDTGVTKRKSWRPSA